MPGMILGEVGACNGGRLGVDLGVQALELARMTHKSACVGGNLSGVLVLHDMQLERVSFSNASGVSGTAAVRASMVEFVWFWYGFG
jgi:hypothetical protein